MLMPSKVEVPAPNLVENQQTVRRCVPDDLGHLAHLHHESGLTGGQVIRRADTGENAVGDADIRRSGRHEAADLGKDDDQRDLAHVGWIFPPCWGL